MTRYRAEIREGVTMMIVADVRAGMQLDGPGFIVEFAAGTDRGDPSATFLLSPELTLELVGILAECLADRLPDEIRRRGLP